MFSTPPPRSHSANHPALAERPDAGLVGQLCSFCTNLYNCNFFFFRCLLWIVFVWMLSFCFPLSPCFHPFPYLTLFWCLGEWRLFFFFFLHVFIFGCLSPLGHAPDSCVLGKGNICPYGYWAMPGGWAWDPADEAGSCGGDERSSSVSLGWGREPPPWLQGGRGF